MKKLTTILLAVAMTLPLVACGGGNAGNTNGGNTNSGSTDKHTHVEEVMPAVELTCTKTGLTEGKRCSECGAENQAIREHRQKKKEAKSKVEST